MAPKKPGGRGPEIIFKYVCGWSGVIAKEYWLWCINNVFLTALLWLVQLYGCFVLTFRCCWTRADRVAKQSAISSSLRRMMEDFRNIADETFPSFLGHSLSSSASVIFENVTISSNPGLPVAASTVARSKTGCDNRWDYQLIALNNIKNSWLVWNI